MDEGVSPGTLMERVLSSESPEVKATHDKFVELVGDHKMGSTVELSNLSTVDQVAVLEAGVKVMKHVVGTLGGTSNFTESERQWLDAGDKESTPGALSDSESEVLSPSVNPPTAKEVLEHIV
jgi:hypothetical protein